MAFSKNPLLPKTVSLLVAELRRWLASADHEKDCALMLGNEPYKPALVDDEKCFGGFESWPKVAPLVESLDRASKERVLSPEEAGKHLKDDCSEVAYIHPSLKNKDQMEENWDDKSDSELPKIIDCSGDSARYEPLFTPEERLCDLSEMVYDRKFMKEDTEKDLRVHRYGLALQKALYEAESNHDRSQIKALKNQLKDYDLQKKELEDQLKDLQDKELRNPLHGQLRVLKDSLNSSEEQILKYKHFENVMKEPVPQKQVYIEYSELLRTAITNFEKDNKVLS
jgi:hypothetical protein